MEVVNDIKKSLLEKYAGLFFIGLGGLFTLLFFLAPHFPENLRWLGGEQTGIGAFVAFLIACWIQIPKLKWVNTWLPVTLGILTFPFLCYALGSTGFLFGISITRWHGVLAFLFTLVCMAYVAENRRSFLLSCLIFVMVWGFSLFFSILSCEHREDGMMYHKPASIMIAKGWNPVWEENLVDYVTEHNGNIETFRYSHVAFFPKGLWVINATLHLMTGTVESGTSVYIAMMFACTILFYFMLQEWFQCPQWAALLGSGVLALNNDIIQEEIFSGMIDGPLALCLVTFLLAGILWLRSGHSKWLPFFIGSAVFGCSLKHNAPVFFVFMGFCLTFPYMIRWCWQKFGNQITCIRNPAVIIPTVRVPLRNWLLALFCVPTFVAVFCFNPFITNFLFHSSPFYPLHTLNEAEHPKEDILEMYYVRPDFAGASKSQRFLYTFLMNRIFFVAALSQDPPNYTPGGVHFMKFWLPVGKNFPIGIFSITLILTIPFLFFVRRWDFWIIIVTIIASTAIHPHSWWGRFVPQIWALPILVSCFLLYEIPLLCGNASSIFVKSWVRRWNVLIYGLLVWCFWINIYLISYFCFSQLKDNSVLIANIEEMKAKPEVVLVGGFTEAKKDEVQIFSHPRYLYYLQDLMNAFGCKNIYYSVINGPKPEGVKNFQLYRCLFLYPDEKEKAVKEEKAPNKNSRKPVKMSTLTGLRKMLSVRLAQFQQSWGEGLYPDSSGTTQEINTLKKPLPDWIVELKKKDKTDLVRDWEVLLNPEYVNNQIESREEK